MSTIKTELSTLRNCTFVDSASTNEVYHIKYKTNNSAAVNVWDKPIILTIYENASAEIEIYKNGVSSESKIYPNTESKNIFDEEFCIGDKLTILPKTSAYYNSPIVSIKTEKNVYNLDDESMDENGYYVQTFSVSETETSKTIDILDSDIYISLTPAPYNFVLVDPEKKIDNDTRYNLAFYSDSTLETEITEAAYGSIVYYKMTQKSDSVGKYDLPVNSTGSFRVVATNNDLSFDTNNKKVTFINLPECTRHKYTVTFNFEKFAGYNIIDKIVIDETEYSNGSSISVGYNETKNYYFKMSTGFNTEYNSYDSDPDKMLSFTQDAANETKTFSLDSKINNKRLFKRNLISLSVSSPIKKDTETTLYYKTISDKESLIFDAEGTVYQEIGFEVDSNANKIATISVAYGTKIYLYSTNLPQVSFTVIPNSLSQSFKFAVDDSPCEITFKGIGTYADEIAKIVKVEFKTDSDTDYQEVNINDPIYCNREQEYSWRPIIKDDFTDYFEPTQTSYYTGTAPIIGGESSIINIGVTIGQNIESNYIRPKAKTLSISYDSRYISSLVYTSLGNDIMLSSANSEITVVYGQPIIISNIALTTNGSAYYNKTFNEKEYIYTGQNSINIGDTRESKDCLSPKTFTISLSMLKDQDGEPFLNSISYRKNISLHHFDDSSTVAFSGNWTDISTSSDIPFLYGESVEFCGDPVSGKYVNNGTEKTISTLSEVSSTEKRNSYSSSSPLIIKCVNMSTRYMPIPSPAPITVRYIISNCTARVTQFIYPKYSVDDSGNLTTENITESKNINLTYLSSYSFDYNTKISYSVSANFGYTLASGTQSSSSVTVTSAVTRTFSATANEYYIKYNNSYAWVYYGSKISTYYKFTPINYGTDKKVIGLDISGTRFFDLSGSQLVPTNAYYYFTNNVTDPVEIFEYKYNFISEYSNNISLNYDLNTEFWDDSDSINVSLNIINNNYNGEYLISESTAQILTPGNTNIDTYFGIKTQRFNTDSLTINFPTDLSNYVDGISIKILKPLNDDVIGSKILNTFSNSTTITCDHNISYGARIVIEYTANNHSTLANSTEIYTLTDIPSGGVSLRNNTGGGYITYNILIKMGTGISRYTYGGAQYTDTLSLSVPYGSRIVISNITLQNYYEALDVIATAYTGSLNGNTYTTDEIYGDATYTLTATRQTSAVTIKYNSINHAKLYYGQSQKKLSEADYIPLPSTDFTTTIVCNRGTNLYYAIEYKLGVSGLTNTALPSNGNIVASTFINNGTQTIDLSHDTVVSSIKNAVSISDSYYYKSSETGNYCGLTSIRNTSGYNLLISGTMCGSATSLENVALPSSSNLNFVRSTVGYSGQSSKYTNNFGIYAKSGDGVADDSYLILSYSKSPTFLYSSFSATVYKKYSTDTKWSLKITNYTGRSMTFYVRQKRGNNDLSVSAGGVSNLLSNSIPDLDVVLADGESYDKQFYFPSGETVYVFGADSLYMTDVTGITFS